MAELIYGAAGPSQLILQFDILEKLPREGMIYYKGVSYNSEIDVLRARVTFQVGEQVILQEEVIIHNDYASSFLNAFERLVSGVDGDFDKIYSSQASPGVVMIAYRSGTYYDLIVMVDAAMLGGDGVSGRGPAIYFEPQPEEILQFLRDLRSEMELALLIG